VVGGPRSTSLQLIVDEREAEGSESSCRWRGGCGSGRWRAVGASSVTDNAGERVMMVRDTEEILGAKRREQGAHR
jgi:hypothetical protein